jgi:hypothetical protein
MKKYFILMGVAAGMVLLSNCSSTKKTASTTSAVHKSTFANEMTTVINMNCSPCHIPAKGGNKKAYDNYANTKADINEIIRRIELNPGDRGFMPFKHPKLPDSTIMVFKKWRDDGMLEK